MSASVNFHRATDLAAVCHQSEGHRWMDLIFEDANRSPTSFSVFVANNSQGSALFADMQAISDLLRQRHNARRLAQPMPVVVVTIPELEHV